jgi:hypothetical protein
VAAKRTPYNAEIHRLFQLRLWFEYEEESTQSDCESVPQSLADGSPTCENKDDMEGYTIEPLVIAGGEGLHMAITHTKNDGQKNNSVVEINNGVTTNEYLGEDKEEGEDSVGVEDDNDDGDSDELVENNFDSVIEEGHKELRVSPKRQKRDDDIMHEKNNNATGNCFDIGKEEEKERALSFLMKAYEHHISLSSDYQGQIATHDAVRELHEQRAIEIKEVLSTFLGRDLHNIGVEKKKEDTLSFWMDAFKTHKSRSSEYQGYVLAYSALKEMNDERSTQIRKRILQIIHDDNN